MALSVYGTLYGTLGISCQANLFRAQKIYHGPEDQAGVSLQAHLFVLYALCCHTKSVTHLCYICYAESLLIHSGARNMVGNARGRLKLTSLLYQMEPLQSLHMLVEALVPIFHFMGINSMVQVQLSSTCSSC